MKEIISIGKTCITANILRHYNFRAASYPFDWQISNFDYILDCIKNDFKKLKDERLFCELLPSSKYFDSQ